jgi:hypothetical protein
MIAHAICCADVGYPELDSSACICKSWGCKVTATSCICEKGLNGDVALPSLCPGTYDHCCALNDTQGETIGCWCGTHTCASDEVEVASCGVAEASCGSKTLVSACR